jgi:hypothetical protein
MRFGAFFLRDSGIGDGLLAVAGSILPTPHCGVYRA